MGERDGAGECTARGCKTGDRPQSNPFPSAETQLLLTVYTYPLTILEEEPGTSIHDTAFLSGAALTEDWNRPEEDAAWSHLQQAWPS
jgi:hypothetical protein